MSLTENVYNHPKLSKKINILNKLQERQDFAVFSGRPG